MSRFSGCSIVKGIGMGTTVKDAGPNSGFGLRWAIIRNPEKGLAARGFALAELVLLPFSFVTCGYVVVNGVLGRFGVDVSGCLPTWLSGRVLTVLIAAAIGYVTNWLAILMLFRPYEEKKWLFVWPQGLLPRNKANMARQIGHQVGNELLPAEALIAEFEQEARSFLSRPETMEKGRKMAQEMLQRHEEDIVRLLVPEIENAVGGILERFITPDQLQTFWDETLAPRLKDPETRDFLAKKIIEVIPTNAPELVRTIRTRLRAHLSALPLLPDFLVDPIMDFFADEAVIRSLLAEWLSAQSTQDMFRDKLLLVGEKAGEWLKSEQGRVKLEGFTGELKRKGRAFITQYVREEIPKLVSRAFSSEKLWNWVENTALPNAKDRLLAYLAENKDALVEKLRLAERVEDAINAQDIAHFHRILNELAAQHLSAIQVLGYVLGALVGGIQLLAR